MKTKVIWKPEEVNAFFIAARTFGVPERGDTNDIWFKAQEKAGFKPERRRAFDPAWAAKMNAERKKGGHYNGVMTAPPKPVLVKPQEELQPLPIQHEQVPPVLPEFTANKAPQPVVSEATTGLLYNAIAPIVTPAITAMTPLFAEAIKDVFMRVLNDNEIRQALREIVAETLAPESELVKLNAVTWRVPKVERERFPRIVVAGGKEYIRDALFALKNVDLRLWSVGINDGSNIHRLTSIVTNADHVFVCINNINHSAVGSLKNRYSTRPDDITWWTKPLNDLAPHIQEFVDQWKRERE